MAKIDAAHFDIAIYGGKVYVVDSLKKFNKICRKIGAAEADESYAAGCTSDGQGSYMVGVFVTDRKDAIVHECAHLAFEILERAGIDPREGVNEAFCYLIGYLYNEVNKLQPQVSPAV